MQPLIELENVSRHYAAGTAVVRALDDCSLAIWAGEFVAIMGQSGSGKSTLMNVIGCLDRPTAGRYRVDGVDVATLDGDELAALRRNTFGFVFQRYNLIATATAEENVEIPAVYAGLPRDARIGRARALLTQLGIGDRATHRPGELSGGQQQRVAIARALMNDPPVVLADEPTGALDSRSGREVMALLKELHAAGRTIILITHDEALAREADRVIRISDGRIVDDGQPDAPSTAPATAFTAVGAPGVVPEILESTKMALRALHANFFRTALTLLGIVIGVASVVTMLAIGSGSTRKVMEQISAMGTNLLIARPGAMGFRGGGDIVTMTVEDAKAIAELPNVDYVMPERSSRYTARYGNADYMTTVTGAWPAMDIMRDWPLSAGSFFTERDVTGYAPVVVLGSTVVKQLFANGEDPIGRFVLLRNVPFEVIGVLSPKGASMFGSDQDDVVFIPLTTGLIRLFGGTHVHSITVKVDDLTKIAQTEEAMNKLLRERHRTEDFSVRNMASMIEMASSTQQTLTLLLGAVALISLVVGGIGVMNIMLVSVTERMREIGIRVATGARMRDILLQFNTEAAVVGMIGGIIGVAFGIGIALLLGQFGVEVAFSPWPSLGAFTSALITGLVFGFLPARKAARLDPVVALASE
ncbi:MAG TPA: MacB family efflux pump subunit [Gammaproteobacteria bacterium]|nr:MacB family efflux pump subunit [Gammaproteobacteria bacterium]